MGFFSQDCIECGDSIIAPYDMPAGMEWQNKAVVFTPNGSMLRGDYDGYGAVGYDADGMGRYDIGMDNTVYHERCWEAAGKPMEYRGPSDGADDQGFFYDRTAATCKRQWVSA